MKEKDADSKNAEGAPEMRGNNYLRALIQQRQDSPAFIAEQALLELSNMIADCMEHSNLSRSALAEKADLHNAQVTRILKGDHNVTVKTICRIAVALGKTVEIRMSSMTVQSERIKFQFIPAQQKNVEITNCKVISNDSVITDAA
ncbi:MAG: helix-turn-helix transcriptional regulator [Candidatus Sumerlaeia bacterium]